MSSLHTLWFSLVLLAIHTQVAAQKMVTVKASFQNCATAPKLFTFDGASFDEFQTATGQAGAYTFSVPAAAPRFYYVGSDVTNHTTVILGSETNVLLSGDCNNLRAITVVNSPLNDQYLALRNEFGNLNNQAQQAGMAYRSAMNNPAALPQAKSQMAQVDQKRQHLLDSLRTANPFLATIAALNTYLSFPNHGEGRYPNELMYFAAEYFRMVSALRPFTINIIPNSQNPYIFKAQKSAKCSYAV